MNEFGRVALEYWRDYRPKVWSTISDPQEYFTDLGNQVREGITDLSIELESRATLSEDYLTRVGQVAAIDAQAREIVMADLVYLPPETTDDQDEPPIDPADLVIGLDGMPIDRSHPLWDALEDDSVTPEEFAVMTTQWRAEVPRSFG